MNTYECLNSTLLYTEDKDYQPCTVSVRVLLRKSPRFSDSIYDPAPLLPNSSGVSTPIFCPSVFHYIFVSHIHYILNVFSPESS